VEDFFKKSFNRLAQGSFLDAHLLRHPPHLCSSNPLEVSLPEPMALATGDRATTSVQISPEASAYGSEYIHTNIKLGFTTPEPMALATGVRATKSVQISPEASAYGSEYIHTNIKLGFTTPEPMALATGVRATKSVPISPEASAYGSEYIHTNIKLGFTTPEPMALATGVRAAKSVPISPEASAYGSEYIHTNVKLGFTTPEPMALATGFFLAACPSTENNPHPTSPATAYRTATVTNKTTRDRHSNPLRSTARVASSLKTVPIANSPCFLRNSKHLRLNTSFIQYSS
jgi:hypothetical protein